MNTKHIVFSLLILTKTSCWGAANNPNLDRKILSELGDTLVNGIAEQADIQSLNAMGQTDPNLIQIASYELYKQLLKKHKGNLNAALFDAAENNYPRAIVRLVQEGANVDTTNAKGQPALMEAAMNDHNDVVTLLLDLGAGIDNPDSLGRTPLMGAAMAGNAQIVQTLLERGANKNLVSSIGDTVVSCAMNIYPNNEVLDILEDAGQADLQSLNTMGQADPNLMELPSTELYKMLLNGHKGNLNAALFDAATNNEFPRAIVHSIIRLVQEGADVNAPNPKGETPLVEAAMNDHNDVVTLLLDLGAGIDNPDALGRTPLMGAAVAGRAQIVQTLLERGANKNLRNARNETALSFAMLTYPNDEVIDLLENWVPKGD